MSTHLKQDNNNTTYFITFTCYRWKHLIKIANAYHAFYKWFEYLGSIQVKILGYVIMPNHFHGIFYLPGNSSITINQIIGNGKRFIAYDIIKRLEDMKNEALLQELFLSTTKREKESGKKHRVFITSFDAKEIYDVKILLTKLEYIHRNPCQGKWNLADNYSLYPHSSAGFYEHGFDQKWISDYRDIF